MLLSSVNFDTKNFYGFTLHHKTKRLNTFRLGQQVLTLVIFQLNSMIRILKRSCKLNSIQQFSLNLSSKRASQSIQLCTRKPQRHSGERETRLLFPRSKVCSEKESVFRVHTEKHRTWKFQIFLPTRKQHISGLVETCVDRGRLDKAKGSFQQN